MLLKVAVCGNPYISETSLNLCSGTGVFSDWAIGFFTLIGLSSCVGLPNGTDV